MRIVSQNYFYFYFPKVLNQRHVLTHLLYDTHFKALNDFHSINIFLCGCDCGISCEISQIYEFTIYSLVLLQLHCTVLSGGDEYSILNKCTELNKLNFKCDAFTHTTEYRTNVLVKFPLFAVLHMECLRFGVSVSVEKSAQYCENIPLKPASVFAIQYQL